jgi:hypothetical protein
MRLKVDLSFSISFSIFRRDYFMRLKGSFWKIVQELRLKILERLEEIEPRLTQL